eukprot:jgi/Bigna1/134275/aug1.24_g8983
MAASLTPLVLLSATIALLISSEFAIAEEKVPQHFKGVGRNEGVSLNTNASSSIGEIDANEGGPASTDRKIEKESTGDTKFGSAPPQQPQQQQQVHRFAGLPHRMQFYVDQRGALDCSCKFVPVFDELNSKDTSSPSPNQHTRGPESATESTEPRSFDNEKHEKENSPQYHQDQPYHVSDSIDGKGPWLPAPQAIARRATSSTVGTLGTAKKLFQPEHCYLS